MNNMPTLLKKKPRWPDHEALYRRVVHVKSHGTSSHAEAADKSQSPASKESSPGDLDKASASLSGYAQMLYCTGHSLANTFIHDFDKIAAVSANISNVTQLKYLLWNACDSYPLKYDVAKAAAMLQPAELGSQLRTWYSFPTSMGIHSYQALADEYSKFDLALSTHLKGAAYLTFVEAKKTSQSTETLHSADSNTPQIQTLSLDAQPEPAGKTSLIEWISSPDELLNRLEDIKASPEDRITAVLFTETTALPESLKPRFLHALHQFADLNRFSKDEEVIAAVGSAVRKLAMNMPHTEFESYARLFLPTSTNTLSCGVELELAKAVGWRLVKLKNARAGDFPELEARLSELASDYLSPRLILQENYAAIVINAVLAVCLLNGERQDELIDRVVKLKMDWFRDLLGRRLLDVAHKRQSVDSGDAENIFRLHKLLALVAQ